MAKKDYEFCDVDFLRRLERLSIIAKRVTAGAPGGRRRGRALGDGLEWSVITGTEAFTIQVVPEPGTLVMLITGGLGLAVLAWRRHRS